MVNPVPRPVPRSPHRIVLQVVKLHRLPGQGWWSRRPRLARQEGFQWSILNLPVLRRPADR